MNTIVSFYVKNRIRQTCYKYKYYLVKYEESIDKLSIKITTKDKTNKFDRIIEKEYPIKNILRHLQKYLNELIFRMKILDPVENITSEEYNQYIKLLNN